jgi:hypothetical protein
MSALKGRSVAELATDLGLVTGRGQTLRPCPACRAERRSRRDGRAPVQLYDARWYCFACSHGGDAVDLLSYVMHGTAFRALDDSRRAEVRAWAARRGWCEVGKSLSSYLDSKVARYTAIDVAKRPDAGEVAAVWGSARQVTSDTEASSWCQGRGLDPERLDGLDLVRVLAIDAGLPAWARYRGTPWSRSGHRLITRVWDAQGRLSGVHARNVRADASPGNKAAWPACGPGSAGGLLMADAAGQRLLAGTPRGPAQDALARSLIVMAEGLPDFLTWAAKLQGDDARPVFGVGSGSWTDAVAARIPSGCRVVVRTHHDAAGEKYARRICETLAGRCTVLRSAPRTEEKENAHATAR